MMHDPFGFSLFDVEAAAGVDEVGIGPLAGPVTAAAVILDRACPIDGLNDSKKLTAKRRSALAEEIRRCADSWAIGWASVEEIDELNILRASHLAMQRALAQLQTAAELVYIDGNKTIALKVPCIAVIKGDQRVPQISAASILAKQARDALMLRLHEAHPQYGFAQHKGYPTRAHLSALETHGASPMHRRSFAPVAALVQNSEPACSLSLEVS